MFRHTKIFFNNNTETEYTSCGTYLCLLFHIVLLDIKALVPWHQFVYTLFISCGHLVIQPASFRSSSSVKHLPTRCSFIFGNRKKFDDARSGQYVGCSKMSQCNFSFVSAGQYTNMHCRTTEQFHARACFFGKLT